MFQDILSQPSKLEFEINQEFNGIQWIGVMEIYRKASFVPWNIGPSWRCSVKPILGAIEYNKNWDIETGYQWEKIAYSWNTGHTQRNQSFKIFSWGKHRCSLCRVVDFGRVSYYLLFNCPYNHWLPKPKLLKGMTLLTPDRETWCIRGDSANLCYRFSE